MATYSYTKSEISPEGNPTVRRQFVAVMNAFRRGGFIGVEEFHPKHGFDQIQNGVFQHAINYGTALATSKDRIATIQQDEAFEVTVTRGTWQDANGNPSPTNRKSVKKGFVNFDKITKTYRSGDAVLKEAIDKLANDVQRSIDGDTKPTVEYIKLGKGVYMHPDTGVMYLRDLNRISKTIVREGNYPNKAQSEVNAIADTIKRTMPIGKYRMFRCDAQFKALRIEGVTIKPEDEVIEGDVTVQTVPLEKVEVEETSESTTPVEA